MCTRKTVHLPGFLEPGTFLVGRAGQVCCPSSGGTNGRPPPPQADSRVQGNSGFLLESLCKNCGVAMSSAGSLLGARASGL